jgi:hypothetical protein
LETATSNAPVLNYSFQTYISSFYNATVTIIRHTGHASSGISNAILLRFSKFGYTSRASHEYWGDNLKLANIDEVRLDYDQRIPKEHIWYDSVA